MSAAGIPLPAVSGHHQRTPRVLRLAGDRLPALRSHLLCHCQLRQILPALGLRPVCPDAGRLTAGCQMLVKQIARLPCHHLRTVTRLAGRHGILAAQGGLTFPDASGRVAARGALALLDVIRATPTAPAQRVSLVVALACGGSKRQCSDRVISEEGGGHLVCRQPVVKVTAEANEC